MNVLPELKALNSGAWSCIEQEAKPYSCSCILPVGDGEVNHLSGRSRNMVIDVKQ